MPNQLELPPSLRILESKPTRFQVVAIAEVGDTVAADHLLQMATLTPEHKPTVLGVPGHVPIPYHLECTMVVLRSSLTFLLVWLALTTHLRLQWCTKRTAGRAITKLLTTFQLKDDHQRYFIRPVGREEALPVNCNGQIESADAAESIAQGALHREDLTRPR